MLLLPLLQDLWGAELSWCGAPPPPPPLSFGCGGWTCPLSSPLVSAGGGGQVPSPPPLIDGRGDSSHPFPLSFGVGGGVGGAPAMLRLSFANLLKEDRGIT